MRRLVLVALLLGVAAFTPPAAAGDESPEPPPRWHVPGTEWPGPPWGGCKPTRGRGFFPIERPQAHLATPEFDTFRTPRSVILDPERWAEMDRMRAGRRTVHVTEDGSVYLREYEFDFAPRDGNEHLDAQWAFEDALRTIVRVDEAHRPVRTLAVHADRHAPWNYVRVCLRAPLRLKQPLHHVQFPVLGNRRHDACNVDVDLSWRDLAAMGADALELALTRKGTGSAAATTLRAGDRAWTFPAGDKLRDAAFLHAANRVWRKIESFLQGRIGQTPPRLLLDDGLDVPWVYVVALLDLLHGLGAEHVALPTEDGNPPALDLDNRPALPPPHRTKPTEAMVLSFRPLPPLLPEPSCRPLPETAVPWPWLVLAGLLAAVVAARAGRGHGTRRAP